LFKDSAALAIAIGSLVVNIIQVPLVMLVLTRAAEIQAAGGRTVGGQAAGARTTGGQTAGGQTAGGRSAGGRTAGDQNVGGQAAGEATGAVLLANLRQTIGQPVVWAPLAAFGLVVLGVRLPAVLHSALMLLGGATSGVALFASGATLFAEKVALTRPVWINVVSRNLVVPGVVWGLLVLTGTSASSTGLVVATLAIPTAAVPTILAIRFGVATREMASTLFVSTISSVLTMGLFLFLTA
jgi:predicted permease